MAAAQVILAGGVGLDGVRDQVAGVIDRELPGIQHFTNRLIHGELAVW